MESNNKFGKTVRVAVCTRAPMPGDLETAKEYHVQLVHCPAYTYRWMTPSESTVNSLMSKKQPDAWVFTSRRGVEGWWRIWNRRSHRMSERFLRGVSGDSHSPGGTDRNNSPNITEKADSPDQPCPTHSALIPPVYVVGDKTEEVVRELFGSAASASAASSATSSSACSASSSSSTASASQASPAEVRKAQEQHATALGYRMVLDGIRTAVHFCGVERRPELRDVCRKFDLELAEVEVYRSCAVKNPEPVKGSVDAILFFSPKGVSEFCRLYGLPEGGWEAVAVGPTTAGAVRHETGREPRVASSPSFREMIKLVSSKR